MPVDMNGCVDDQRPPKRRKLAEPENDAAGLTYQQLVLEELDVELGLRQRLYETIHSRLTWALLLQEALQKESRPRNGESDDFRTAALDALKAAEEPSKPLFDRELFPIERLAAPSPTTPSIDTPVNPHYVPRASSSRVRRVPRGQPQSVKKLLFLRNTNTDPPEIAKLACPNCARSDFSNLQGLLNHCRIRHGLEFGSHDECMQSCAVIVPEAERDWVIASGTELSGISLPSLRRLFEIAVGAGDNFRIPGVRKEPDQQEVVEANASVDKHEELQDASTEVTKTLGFHKDTPALAPFLGREPKKRVINVYEDPNEVLDILSDSAGPTNSLVARKGWRKHYSHRNTARAELDEVPSEPAEPPDTCDERPQSQTPVAGVSSAVGIASSRFHIVARIKVVDSSLWMPPERRREDRPEHTHRWRLAVSSPSYSLHITTFLEKLTVTCVSDPPPLTLIIPIVVTEPPFAVTSTTDRPFLARLTLTWIGSVNAPVDIEHWVDIDPLHLGHPVLGDEQVSDVELDRNTQLLPVREDVRKLSWKGEDVGDNDRDKFREQNIDGIADGDERGISSVLRMLLQEVPVTVRDARSCKRSVPACALVPTLAQYRNLTPGRRKAIELSRARALLAAYREHTASADYPGSSASLSVADVYHWMEEERLFPRDVVARDVTKDGGPYGKTADAHQVPEAFCRFCGLHEIFHPGVKTEDGPHRDVKLSHTAACIELNAASSGLPLLDVNLNRLLQRRPGESFGSLSGLSEKLWTTRSSSMNPKRTPSSADLVAIAHPAILTAIRKLAAEWRLANLQAPIKIQRETEDGLQLASRTPVSHARQELLDDLAPYAMLTAAADCMVRLLVRSGLDALRRDESALRSLLRPERARRKGGKVEMGGPSVRQLLTPSHILRGLTINATRGLTESATLVCLARFGLTISAEPRERVVTGIAPVGAMQTPDEVRVKEEDG